MSEYAWLRLWTQSLFSPKIQKLTGNEYKFWGNFLCAARMHSGKVSLKDLKFYTRLSQNKFDFYVESLLDKHLATREEEYLVPHDWSRWQYESDSSTERVRKHREKRKGNVSETVDETLQERSMKQIGNVSETPPDTDTDTDTEKEKSARETSTKKPSNSRLPDDAFIASLKCNPAYISINIDMELAKMDAWLSTPKGKNRKKTRQFIVNWLNKIDVPVHSNGNGSHYPSHENPDEWDEYERAKGAPRSQWAKNCDPKTGKVKVVL